MRRLTLSFGLFLGVMNLNASRGHESEPIMMVLEVVQPLQVKLIGLYPLNTADESKFVKAGIEEGRCYVSFECSRENSGFVETNFNAILRAFQIDEENDYLFVKTLSNMYEESERRLSDAIRDGTTTDRSTIVRSVIKAGVVDHARSISPEFEGMSDQQRGTVVDHLCAVLEHR